MQEERMKEYLLLFRSGLDFKTVSPEQLEEAVMKWRQPG